MRWLALLMLMIFVAGSSLGTCMAHSDDTLKPFVKGKAGGGFKSSSKHKIDFDDEDSGGGDGSPGGGWVWLLVLVIVIVVIAVLVLVYLRR
ncbi:hypothetical protein [Methanothermobacter thermautotrophicus]|nr:hypothetical protein [Methanothermobacter thermautotrophicus]